MAEAQNNRIIDFIPTGPKVIEVGCGYGFLTKMLKEKGFFSAGIDLDQKVLKTGKDMFPETNLFLGDVCCLSFKDKSLDYIIFRESVYHFFLNDKLWGEVSRIIKKGVIIFDPNPNVIVKTCRKLIGHIDNEVKDQDCIKVLEQKNFSIKHTRYSDIIAFPLSGGLVGVELVPNFKILWKVLLLVHEILNKVFELFRLQNIFCWRYLLIAEKS